MRYVVGRIVHGLALLIAVSVLSFLMAELAPGDYLADLELAPDVSEETVQRMRERFGLDQPLMVRYAEWLRSVLRGEFGFSVGHQVSAGTLLLPRARNTLLLAASALVLAWMLAVPLGVWSAYRRGSALDKVAVAISSILLATPAIVVGLLFLLISARSEFFPIGGMTSLDFDQLGTLAKAGDLTRHLILPALALAVASFPVVFGHARAALVDVMDAPYLRAGLAHGIPLPRLLFRQALRAAANPLVSLFGLSIAGLLSGSLLVEVIMSWPGLGQLLIDAILARDVHLVVGAVMLSSVFLVGGNLMADLMLYWVDPRTRKA